MLLLVLSMINSQEPRFGGGIEQDLSNTVLLEEDLPLNMNSIS